MSSHLKAHKQLSRSKVNIKHARLYSISYVKLHQNLINDFQVIDNYLIQKYVQKIYQMSLKYEYFCARYINFRSVVFSYCTNRQRDGQDQKQYATLLVRRVDTFTHMMSDLSLGSDRFRTVWGFSASLGTSKNSTLLRVAITKFLTQTTDLSLVL